MKVAVLGAGLMGKQAAGDLIANDLVEKVYLADLNIAHAKIFQEHSGSPKLEALYLDAADDDALAAIMAKADVVINALFYTFNEKVAKMAIACGVHAVDLGGHIGGATDAVLKMDGEAKRKGVTVIPDLGVAPGMINILAGYGSNRLDRVRDIRIMVGGIPVHPDPPLQYNHVFSWEGVFDHYTDPSHIIRKGEFLEVPSLSEIETVEFEGFGELEAFHTSGGTSTLTETFRHAENLEYKTIRYKGHAEKFQLLVDLGFTDRNKTVKAGGQLVKIRDVLREVLIPLTELGDKEDAVLLRVNVAGSQNGEDVTYVYEMVAVKEKGSTVTAMARAAAYTVSAVAVMIGSGLINKRGAYPPEKIVPGREYIEEMAKRGTVIKESVHGRLTGIDITQEER